MHLDLNSIYSAVEAFHTNYLAFYFYIAFIFVAIFVFTIKVFFVLKVEGFNKESSLDTLFFVNSTFIISFFLVGNFSIEGFSYYIESFRFVFSFFLVYVVLLLKAKFSHWSFLKLLDVFSLYFCAFFGYTLLVLSYFSWSQKILLLSILFLFFYYVFHTPYKEKFNINFLFFKLTKKYELSLIGLVFYICVIYISIVLQVLAFIFDKELNIVLIFLNSVTILYAFLGIYKISKFYSIKWGYQLNLFKNKQIFFWIRRKKLISRLGD